MIKEVCKEFVSSFKAAYKDPINNKVYRSTREWDAVKKLVDKDGKARISYDAFYASMGKEGLRHPISFYWVRTQYKVSEYFPILDIQMPAGFDRYYHVSLWVTKTEAYLYIEYAGIAVDFNDIFGNDAGMIYKIDRSCLPSRKEMKKFSISDSPEIGRCLEDFIRNRPDSDDKNRDMVANYRFAI